MRPIFTAFLLCISVVSATAERHNFEDTETLQYIQEKRLRNVAELERLERLELLAKERQLQTDGYSYRQDRRRLQEQPDNTEMGQEDFFNDFNRGEDELEGFTFGSLLPNINRGQLFSPLLPNNNRGQEYYPPSNYGRQSVDPRYNQNQYNSNPNSQIYNSGYPNNNHGYNRNNMNQYPAYPSSGRNVGSGRYGNNDGWGTPFNSQLTCCQDCRRGDVNCLSNCNRICENSQQCSKAGEGAYAAFCQTACPNSVGGFGLTSQYLPIKACEGECAAQVQELCEAHSCRDYGCRARDCHAQAPLKCQMT